MTFSTSAVAVCCSSASARCFRASANSLVRWSSCFSRFREGTRPRAGVGPLLRLGFVVLPCCVFAGLRLIVRRRLTEPCLGPTTIRYHIMRSVVHHSRIGGRSSATGQNPNLPHCNSNGRFTSMSGHAAASSRPRSGARCRRLGAPPGHARSPGRFVRLRTADPALLSIRTER